MPGFKRAKVSGIKLDVNSQVRRDLALSVGEVSESVQVQASAVQVNTSTGTVATTITTEQIHTAVLNGRHYSRLAMLVPGAVYSSGSDELAGAGLSQTGSPVSINGLNNKSSGWFVDGAYDMNVGNGEANTHVPPIDSIGEVQIQTANYSARYGTTGGAVITSVTKSGTSAFHGSAYEYLRNNAMDARNFFAQNNPPLRQNQYGFSIGGPVVLPHYNKDRNKTFFFWNEEWRKRRNALTSLTATPTDALRSGNFQSEVTRTGRPLLDPLTGQAFPNNTIPANRINANAALLLKTYIPLPNYSSGGFLNYINNGVSKLDTRTDTVKVDHNLTEKIRFSFVISNDAINVLQPDAGLGGSPLPGAAPIREHQGPSDQCDLEHRAQPAQRERVQLQPEGFRHQPAVPGRWRVARAAGWSEYQGLFRGRQQAELDAGYLVRAGVGRHRHQSTAATPRRRQKLHHRRSFQLCAGQAHSADRRFHPEVQQDSSLRSTPRRATTTSMAHSPTTRSRDFLLGSARTYTQGKELFTRSYGFVQTESLLSGRLARLEKAHVQPGLPHVHHSDDACGREPHEFVPAFRIRPEQSSGHQFGGSPGAGTRPMIR